MATIAGLMARLLAWRAWVAVALVLLMLRADGVAGTHARGNSTTPDSSNTKFESTTYKGQVRAAYRCKNGYISYWTLFDPQVCWA